MIKIEYLTMKYGKKVVLDDINLKIKDGIHGFLGQNGSGKTTLLKILATLIKPTSGNIYINDIPISQKKTIRSFIGYIPQEFGLYPEFACYEILDYFSLLDGVKNYKERSNNIEKVLEMVNLLDVSKEKVKNLSGGMRRRLCIAQALLSDPKLIIADEPTANLDPAERKTIRNIFVNLKSKTSLLIASHIMDDIQDCCDSVTIMKKGKILFNGYPDQLKRNIGNCKSIESAYLELVNRDVEK